MLGVKSFSMMRLASTSLKICWDSENKINGVGQVQADPRIDLGLLGVTMFQPTLQKAEEKVRLKKEESPDSKSTPPASSKRLCAVYSKNLAKLPEGDQTLVKDPEFRSILHPMFL